MQWFDQLSFRSKLFINFLLSSGLLIVALLFCVLEVVKVGGKTDEIARDWMPALAASGKISQERLRYRVRSLEYLLPGSTEERAKIFDSLAKLDADLNKVLEDYRSQADSAEERRLIGEVEKGAADYRAAVLQAVELAKGGKEDEAQQLRRKLWVEKANALRDKTDALSKFNTEGAGTAAKQAEAEVSLAESTAIAALLLGSLAAVVFSFWLAQRIGRRLDGAVEAANRIAAGDLGSRIPAEGGDEIGRLLSAMAGMQESLRRTIQESRDEAGTVSSSAHRLNDSVGKTADSTSTQSAAASAIAASVEQLTVSINLVAERLGDASRVAAESDDKAGDGVVAMDKVVSEIRHISTVVNDASAQIAALESQSNQISAIVTVIKEIADQTNLLALNAAIEAARAGEQGRGFAVVADEVRKLAERTTKSTGEITAMIDAIQQSTGEAVAGIEKGVALAESGVGNATEAGSVVRALSELAKHVAEVVAEISGALREQSLAANEVAAKVEQIAVNAEEINATTTETAAAAKTLDEVSERMLTTVGRFRL